MDSGGISGPAAVIRRAEVHTMTAILAALLTLALLLGPLVARIVMDRRAERAAVIAADIRAAVRRRLGGESMVSLDTRAASLFSRGRVLLYAPSGYEGLLEKVWPVVTRRIPAGYDLIVRAPEPPAPAPALHRQLPRAA